jgi:general secretion pathway protein E
MNPKAPRRLDLQQIFTWLMADGLILKDEAKAKYNEAQGILKTAIHHAPVDGNRAM